jgi:hypothetical protein
VSNRSTDEDRWPDDNWSTRTFKDELKQRWNAVIDHSEEDLPELPPRPNPPPAPAASSSFDDPWATASAPHSNFDDEPPF